MKKTKLFILADTIEAYLNKPIGGAEKQILSFCRKIDRSRFDLFVGSLLGPGRLLKEIDKFNIKTVCFNLKRIYSIQGIKQGFRLLSLLKKEEIDILMTYHFGSDIWGTIFGKLAGVPVIISNRRDDGFWKKRHHNSAYRLVNRFVDKIFAVSERVKDSVIKAEGVDKNRVIVLHNGIDFSIFNLNHYENIKERLGIKKDAFLICCVGNLKYIKGQEYLIKALSNLKERIPNITCFFIGSELEKEAEEIKELAKICKVEDICLFLGVRSDIPELLSAVDLCILPSLSEGLSNTLLEYMAAGKPIIATKTGGNIELIQDNKNGALVKPADPDELADKIIFLFENKDVMARLGVKAKEDVESGFSIETMIKKYEALFDELLNEKKRAPAVVLGMSANGLSIARSLGRKGIQVIGIGSGQNEPGMYSRFLKRAITAPNPIYNEKEFLSCLLALGTKLSQKAVLFATADEYISVISRHHKELLPYYNFLLPDNKLVNSFLDKKETYQLANEYGILQPSTFFANSESELKSIVNKIKYPCIIKPRQSHLWKERYNEKKVIIAASVQELTNAFKAVKENSLEVIIQQVIPGPDSNIYEFMAYFDQDSKPSAYFCCRKLRQYPPHFGVGCLSESLNNPKIIEAGLDFFKKIGYKGLGHIEFKIDEETGNLFLLEVNLRTSFIGELSIASGIDLPYIAYRNLAHADSAIKSYNFKENIKLLNFELDAGSFLRSKRNKELDFTGWVKSFKAKKIAHSYFAIDDLKPFFVVYTKFLGLICIKIRSKLFSQREKTAVPKNNTAKPLRIVHLISSNGIFGAEKVMLSLATNMNFNGSKSWVAAVRNTYNPHTEIIEEAKNKNISAITIESKSRFDFESVNRLCEFIKENDINIIHTHNYKSNLLGLLAARRAKIPIVATLHGYIGGDFKLKLYESIDRFALRYFNKVIFVDDSLRKWFKNGLVKCEVINNGVEIGWSGSFSANWLKKPEIVIGTVGRLSEEKGHKYLLEAFSKITKDYSNIRLLIVGNGELKNGLEELSSSLGIKEKVTFTGFQKDVSAYYDLMDIYVSPSLLEHFPLAVLEAMSFGKAIVATNVGGTSNLIKDNVTGILINPSSSEEIHRGILRYLANISLIDNFGSNAQQFVNNNYSLAKMCDSYKKIYVEVSS